MTRDIAAEFADIEYYPGSSKQIPKRASKAEPEARDDSWDSKPKKYTVAGKQYEFFTVGQLAAALGRQAVTVRKWEVNGVIPKAQFAAPSEDPRGRRRLYTRDQVEGMLRIAAEEGVLARKPIGETNFTKRVIDLFGQLKGPGQ